MMSIEFLLTSLIVVLIPGTGVIYTVSAGLFQGWRHSIAAACGCTLGIIPHLLASILGLATLLHMSALAFQAFKYAGVTYLLYLAVKMWRDTESFSFDASRQQKSLRKTAIRGILINILNPKLTLFFVAFLPQFVTTHQTLTSQRQMMWFSFVFMLMTLSIFILYGLGAHKVSQYLLQSHKSICRLQRSFAACFAALGVKLAFSDN